MRMSISTTVGWKRAAFSTASSPLPASATTSMSSSPESSMRKPARDHRLVVRDEHADAHGPYPVSGRRVVRRNPPPLALPAVISPP